MKRLPAQRGEAGESHGFLRCKGGGRTWARTKDPLIKRQRPALLRFRLFPSLFPVAPPQRGGTCRKEKETTKCQLHLSRIGGTPVAENSAIEWTDHTFNPWEGCQKVGPGCDHCYAETRNARFGGGVAGNWGPGAPRRRTSVSNWRKPLRWQADASAFQAAHGRRQRVFCASLADVFDNAVDPAWRADLFELIRATPDLDWLLLTKRIGNVANMLPVPFDFKRRYPNVWIGATIVNQAEAERDIPKLLATPAAVRFLSMEPLLGPVDISWTEVCVPSLDWVIVGGESGAGARPMHPDWARGLRDQCAAAGVPFLFKQWGEWGPNLVRTMLDGDRAGELVGSTIVSSTDRSQIGARVHYAMPANAKSEPGPVERMERVGKKAAGRLGEGVQHDGVPA
jgi:protein gp37